MECAEVCVEASISKVSFSPFSLFKLNIGMISAQQPHISSCIQFLDKGNNDIVWGCAEIFLFFRATVPLGGEATMSWKCESEWMSEWVRVAIESRTSPVFDTMLPILFLLEYLCYLNFALGMIGCIISKYLKQIVLCQLWSFLCAWNPKV